MPLTFADLRGANAFAELARLYPDEVSTRNLLEDLGVAPGRLRPYGQVSQELYWREVARAIGDGAFAGVELADLMAAVLAQWPGNAALRGLDAGAAGPDSGELRVLCLSAGPSDQNAMRLAAEFRAIQLAASGATRRIIPVMHPATQPADISSRLLDARPQILHFAGHGDQHGALFFETEAGLTAPVDLGKLARLIGAVGRLQGLVLTSCYSAQHAAELLAVSDHVIGSPQPLADDCALAFSRNFYGSLGKGVPLPQSFDITVAAMDVEGCPPHELRLDTG